MQLNVIRIFIAGGFFEVRYNDFIGEINLFF